VTLYIAHVCHLDHVREYMVHGKVPSRKCSVYMVHAYVPPLLEEYMHTKNTRTFMQLNSNELSILEFGLHVLMGIMSHSVVWIVMMYSYLYMFQHTLPFTQSYCALMNPLRSLGQRLRTSKKALSPCILHERRPEHLESKYKIH
jgi:hypothetical protein